jgi:hypothetical protein
MKQLIRVVLVAVFMGCSLPCLPALAQQPQVDEASRAVARKLGYEGVEAYQKGDFKTAAEKLGRAYKILQAPSLGLWSARAFEKNGQLVEASERYLHVKRLAVSAGADVAVQQKAQAEAAAEYEALQPRIPQLEIQVAGANPDQIEVTIDGVKVASAMLGVAMPANPGTRKVEGKFGTEVVTESVTLKEGEQKSITLKFTGTGAPAPTEGSGTAAAKTGTPGPKGAVAPADQGAPKSSMQKTLGWAALGVGGVGLVVGVVTGGVAMGKKSQLDTDCPGGKCEPEFYGELDAYNALRVVSTVGFITGVVGAGAGVALILTAPKKREQEQPATASVQPWIGVGSAGVIGTF